jgi:hypothetical protein
MMTSNTFATMPNAKKLNYLIFVSLIIGIGIGIMSHEGSFLAGRSLANLAQDLV